MAELDALKEILHRESCSCVISGKGEVRMYHQRGVRDLYDILQSDSSFMAGSSIADKVVGKAAAALMVKGGVSRLYADTISESAISLLERNGVRVTAGRVVPRIENRDKTGWCPLETICMDSDSIDEMYTMIHEFLNKQKK